VQRCRQCLRAEDLDTVEALFPEVSKEVLYDVCEIFTLAGSDRLLAERLRPKVGRSRDRTRADA